jgi:hypothetical protein
MKLKKAEDISDLQAILGRRLVSKKEFESSFDRIEASIGSRAI